MKFSVFTTVFLSISLGRIVTGSPVVSTASGTESIASTNAVTLDFATIENRSDAGFVSSAASSILKAFWNQVKGPAKAVARSVVESAVATEVLNVINSGYDKLTDMFSTPSNESQDSEEFNIIGDGAQSEILSSYINGVVAQLPSDTNTQCILVEKGQTTSYGGNLIWAPVHFLPTVSGWTAQDFDQFCTNGGGLITLQTSSVTGGPPVIAYSGGDVWKLQTDPDTYQLRISYNLNG